MGFGVAVFVAVSLALFAANVFQSLAVFAIALPAALVVCLAPVWVYGLRERARGRMAEEVARARELERAGHPRHAARAVTCAIEHCDRQPLWDGSEKAQCCDLHAWHRRLVGDDAS